MTVNMFLTSITSSGALIITSLWMPKEPADLKTTQYWRIFIGLPLVFGVIAFIVLLFFKNEPPSFLISKGKDDEAIESIKRIYENNENPEEILEFLKASTS